MKPKISRKLLLSLFLLLFLAGCASLEDNSSKIEDPDLGQLKNQDNGYISNMLNVKDKAKENVQKATEKENAKINEVLGEEQENFSNKYGVVVLETNLGKIKIKLYGDSAPKTVNNFLKLTQQKFYNGTKFHRVIKGFMIQGGDPNSKDNDWSDDGTGGPGYKFEDEINSRKLIRGSLAMANSGPNTNGSQFFIVTAKETPWLDGKHTNFGEVTEGMEVVDQIENVKTNSSNHPLEDIIIQSISLVQASNQ